MNKKPNLKTINVINRVFWCCEIDYVSLKPFKVNHKAVRLGPNLLIQSVFHNTKFDTITNSQDERFHIKLQKYKSHFC